VRCERWLRSRSRRALANHRKTICAELASAAMRARQIKLDRLSGVLASYGLDPKP